MIADVVSWTIKEKYKVKEARKKSEEPLWGPFGTPNQ